MALLSGMPAARVTAQQTGGAPGGNAAADTITLRRGLFSGWRFGHGDPRPSRKVFGMIGFTAEFEELVARHPEAYEAARPAETWTGVAFAGSLAFLASSVLLLVDAVSLSESVNRGDLDHSDTSSAQLALLGIGAAAMIGGGVAAGNYLRRGVRTFNRLGGVSASEGPAPTLQVGLDAFGPGIGVALRWWP